GNHQVLAGGRTELSALEAMAGPHRGKLESLAENAVERDAVEVLDRLFQEMPAVLDRDVELAERGWIALHPDEAVHAHAALGVEVLAPGAFRSILCDRQHAGERHLDGSGFRVPEP